MPAAFPNGLADTERLLNLEEVTRLTALSRATIYRAIAGGAFPPPVKIGRTSRWLASELRNFLAGLSASRDEVGAVPTMVALDEERR